MICYGCVSFFFFFCNSSKLSTGLSDFWNGFWNCLAEFLYIYDIIGSHFRLLSPAQSLEGLKPSLARSS